MNQESIGDLDDSTHRERALSVLHRNVAPAGFVASSALPHYSTVWARDMAFSAMGANVSGDTELLSAVGRSLITLAEHQAPAGQIPNDYWPGRGYWDFHESGSTDATCLFIVAAGDHLALHSGGKLQQRLLAPLRLAYSWLCCQDANQFTLLDLPLGGDWMDSTFQRGGKSLYLNVLWYRALRQLAVVDTEREDQYNQHASLLAEKMNYFLWPGGEEPYARMLSGISYPAGSELEYPHPVGPSAWRDAARKDRWYYISHVLGQRFVDECDVLGNVLAVLYGVADPARARLIMEQLYTEMQRYPYPCPTYTRSFSPTDNPWGMLSVQTEQFQGERWRNPADCYHNGGIWPFIGGLYVAALSFVQMQEEARLELLRLRAANDQGEGVVTPEGEATLGFNEWLHGRTGAPGGAADQAWSAGTYLLAESSVTQTTAALECHCHSEPVRVGTV